MGQNGLYKHWVLCWVPGLSLCRNSVSRMPTLSLSCRASHCIVYKLWHLVRLTCFQLALLFSSPLLWVTWWWQPPGLGWVCTHDPWGAGLGEPSFWPCSPACVGDPLCAAGDIARGGQGQSCTCQIGSLTLCKIIILGDKIITSEFFKRPNWVLLFFLVGGGQNFVTKVFLVALGTCGTLAERLDML